MPAFSPVTLRPLDDASRPAFVAAALLNDEYTMLMTRRFALTLRPGLCATVRGELNVVGIGRPLLSFLSLLNLSNCPTSKKSGFATGRLGEWMLVDGSDIDARLPTVAAAAAALVLALPLMPACRSSGLLTRELLWSSLLLVDERDVDDDVCSVAVDCLLVLFRAVSLCGFTTGVVFSFSTRQRPIVGRL